MGAEIDLESLVDLVTYEIDKPKTVWTDIVPIVEEGNEIHCYLTDQIGPPDIYNKLCHTLNSAMADKIVHVYLNSPGGIIDSANMVYFAMKNSKAKIIGHLSGSVASAATMLTMACDEITVTPFTQFMIHNYSGGVAGKGKEAKDQMDFVNNEINISFRDYYAGFLSEEEISDVIDDHDIWLNSREVLERWDNKKNS